MPLRSFGQLALFLVLIFAVLTAGPKADVA